MSVTIVLECRDCSATTTLRKPYLALTKLGTLRVQVGTDWMVDGNGALCPAHRPRGLDEPRPQRDMGWSDHDRLHVEGELEEEGLLR